MELHNSMRVALTSLLLESDRTFQKEGEKLERLCLSVEEKGLVINNFIIYLIACLVKI